MLKLGDTVTLKAGTPYGMGRLRQDVIGQIDAIQTNDNGQPIYGVRFVNGKRGECHTWMSAEEVQ